MPKWTQKLWLSKDWRKVTLRPEVTFSVMLHDGKAEMCFGLFSCYMNSTPRMLEVGEENKRYSATSEHERYLYLRGDGHVTVEEE